jgi:hypothetical protein
MSQTTLDSGMVGFVNAPAVGIGDLQQFSIALWVELDSMRPGEIQRFVTVQNEKAVLRYDGETGPQQLHFYMKMDDYRMYHIRVNALLTTGVFHHVVGTYDGHTMLLFCDGAQAGVCVTTSVSIHGKSVDLSHPSETLHGQLDEVQIYDRALGAEEIWQLHSSNGAATPIAGTDPVSWWCLDETSGTTAYDCVGSNHGTVEGATWTDGKIGGALRFSRRDDNSMVVPHAQQCLERVGGPCDRCVILSEEERGWICLT